MKRKHEMPFGAEVRSDGSVHFRLWAPKASSVNVVLEKQQKSLPMSSLADGWFEIVTREASVGDGYRLQVDLGITVPDLASRYQAGDVHGASLIVDPCSFDWQDQNWRGRPWGEAVIYELHVGTFTPEGTFAAIEEKLEYLVGLGVTAIELMPISDFPGKRGWGYDGVLPFAPDSSYGRPEDLKQLVQATHSKGLMIFLDVVYNHFGPEGSYIRAYAPEFFTNRHCTPWGDGINYDGQGSRTVRDFVIHNALYWLDEYHFDGLRLDAVHAIADDSRPDILVELAESVRNELGTDRHIHLVLENDDNAPRYLKRDGGCPLWYNAQWNDDIHHALHVISTGETDGYYADYSAAPLRHLVRCLSEGFSYQGEASPTRDGRRRGEPSRDLPPAAFVAFLQNHDQVGNRAFGERIHQLADPKALKAALAIVLLAPSPPLLFMGEEFGANSPFLYFCDFEDGLAEAVREGRRNEFARFAQFSSAETRAAIPDPNDPKTFARSKLDWSSLHKAEHEHWIRFYRELLNIRHSIIVPRLESMTGHNAFSAVKGKTLIVDWLLEENQTLRLMANLRSETSAFPGQILSSVIYSTEKSSDLDMAPWSVVWSVTS